MADHRSRKGSLRLQLVCAVVGLTLLAPIGDVVRYYEERAPEELPSARPKLASGPLPVRFVPSRVPGPPGLDRPAISNVKLACLSDERLPDILATDMRSGRVMALRPREP